MLLIEKLTDKNLSSKISTTLSKLDREIFLIKNNKEMRETKKGSEELSYLVNDLQKLVQISRNLMSSGKNISPGLRDIANKTDKIWREQAYSKIQEYNSLLPEYNKNHPNAQLHFIEVRVGKEVNKSVTTEEVNYFPY